MANRDSGGKLMMAGLIIAFIGLCIVLVQILHVPRYWIPLMVGIGILFFNGRSPWGWLLTAGGALIIFLGILTHLTMFFRPTSLFNTLLMLTLLAGGIGLVARSLRAH